MGGAVIVNQPGVYLVDADGNVVTAADGTTIAGHEGLLVCGKDGSVMRFMRVAADGTLRVDPTGTTTQPISAAALPLPAGAATEAKLEAVRVLLGTIDADTSNLDVALSTLATETKLEAVRVLLASLDAKDFATQTTLAAADAKLGTIDADTGQILLDIQELLARVGDNIASPAADTLQARLQELIDNIGVGATPTTDTLQARLQELLDAFGTAIASPVANTLLARAQTVIDRLTSIKDTDGVQIIDDIVRLGDTARNGINSILNNAIRRLETRGSITSPNGALDVAVIADNSINRLETRGSVVGQVAGTGAETKITVIEDIDNAAFKRLQTEARIAPGSTVNIGTGIPADPASLVISFLTNGGSENMLVNGSVTPVAFEYQPASGVVLSVQQLLVVFAADDFNFDGDSFGPNALLTNGIKFETDIGGVVTEIFNIKQNEDFIRVPGRIPLVNNTGPKDLLGVAFAFGGLMKLTQADDDKLLVTIRDNLTSVKFQYLTCTIYGAEE